MNWEFWQAWFFDLEWQRLVPELIGKGLGFLAGFAASWFFLFRRRLRDLQRFQQGDSDDVLFQAHYLLPVKEQVVESQTAQAELLTSATDVERPKLPVVQLVFRNVVAKLTVNQLYDNPAARTLIKELSGKDIAQRSRAAD